MNGKESRIAIDGIKISKRKNLEHAIVHDGFDHPILDQVFLCSIDGVIFWLKAVDVPENLMVNYLDKTGARRDENIKNAKFYFEQKFKTGGRYFILKK